MSKEPSYKQFSFNPQSPIRSRLLDCFRQYRGQILYLEIDIQIVQGTVQVDLTLGAGGDHDLSAGCFGFAKTLDLNLF